MTANVWATLASGISGQGGPAFDPAGNLYVRAGSDPTCDPFCRVGISVFPKASGTLFGVPVTANTMATLIPAVAGNGAVAFDSRGDLYFANGNAVQELVAPSAGKTLTVTALTYYTTTSDDQAPPVHAGDHVVLVATVEPLSGTAPATGTLDFTDGTTDLGPVALHSYLAASYAILFPPAMGPGTHTITAKYTGDSAFIPSSTTPIHIRVTAQ